MTSAERPDRAGEDDDIPLAPDAQFAPYLIAMSDSHPSKETRVTDVVRALRIREALKDRVLQPLSNAPPSRTEPAL
jgi:hypothetical protein